MKTRILVGALALTALAWTGAAAGCAVGRHRANKQARQDSEATGQVQPAGR